MCIGGCVLAQCSNHSQDVYRGSVYRILMIASFQGVMYEGLC